MPWLPEQVESILAQVGVEVRLIVSDDGSTDGTLAWLHAWDDARIHVMEQGAPSGSAARNFYRLITEGELGDADYVALADQDDVWVRDKLARHVALQADTETVAVSSNVISFDERGREHLIRKDFPQRRFDYLLESPGPGSTFLMTRRLVDAARELLEQEPLAHRVEYHDWLLYALARGSGWRWHIDAVPSVRYRQHASNAMGANVGARSAVSRLRLIRDRWHRSQALLLSDLLVGLDSPDPDLVELRRLLAGTGWRDRLALARRSSDLRRRPRDRALIALLVIAGIW
jgi:rhamnosyltransferase